MSKNISVGIDIGTHKIKVVVSELAGGKDNFPTVIGIGQAEAKGLRHGYITNILEATASVKQAVAEAEKASGVKIENAYFGIGGVGLGSIMSYGSVAITRADMEISKLDIRDAINASEKNIPEAQILNKKIIKEELFKNYFLGIYYKKGIMAFLTKTHVGFSPKPKAISRNILNARDALHDIINVKCKELLYFIFLYYLYLKIDVSTAQYVALY